jgi:hypothetical protein
MEIVYSWAIEQMQEVPQQGPLTDVVINISWRRYATTVVSEKEYIAGTFGFFVCSQPSGEDFTPYEDLTRDQVIGWLEAGLDVEAIDRNLIAQLNDQINPPVVILPLPWEPTTTTTTTTTEAPFTTTTTTTTLA